MTDLEHHAGKTRWIECRAAVLVKLRGMTPGQALVQAKAEFARFDKLDANRKDQQGQRMRKPGSLPAWPLDTVPYCAGRSGANEMLAAML